jgi:hypothetical protein
MAWITVFGVAALTFTMVMYALEHRRRGFVLAFGCALSSAYGFLAGTWPFGVVEAIWSVVDFVVLCSGVQTDPLPARPVCRAQQGSAARCDRSLFVKPRLSRRPAQAGGLPDLVLHLEDRRRPAVLLPTAGYPDEDAISMIENGFCREVLRKLSTEFVGPGAEPARREPRRQRRLARARDRRRRHAQRKVPLGPC